MLIQNSLKIIGIILLIIGFVLNEQYGSAGTSTVVPVFIMFLGGGVLASSLIFKKLSKPKSAQITNKWVKRAVLLAIAALVCFGLWFNLGYAGIIFMPPTFILACLSGLSFAVAIFSNE